MQTLKRVARLFPLLVIAALPAQAQYPKGQVNASPNTLISPQASYSLALDAPLVAPCTVMVSARQNNLTIADSQKNTFVLAGTSNPLWYSTSCSSGADAITVSVSGGKADWAQVVAVAYPGVWTLDQISTEVQNVTSPNGWGNAITPTQNGELIIGIGNNHTSNTPGITAAGGFTLRASGNQFIEDMIQSVAAPIYSEVSYSQALTWCQTTLSFKLAGPPPPPPTHQAALSWTDTVNPAGTRYNVYRSSPACPPAPYLQADFQLIASDVATMSYTDVGLLAATTYCYGISSVDLSGQEGIIGALLFVPGSVSTITVQ